MKKFLVLMIVPVMASAVNAQLELSISGPNSLATNATGTYTVSYSGAAILGADVDIVVDFGSTGGGIILTTNRDRDLDITGINPVSSNYEVSITNDVTATDLGSPLFSIVLTAPSVVPDGNKVTISLIENAFIDLDFNPITGTVMPTKQVTITPFVPESRVTKCTVRAGITQGRDANDINNVKDYFTASGIADFPADRNDVDFIGVNIIDVCDNAVIYSQSIDFNDHNDVALKKGVFHYSDRIARGEAGAITSLKIDFRKNPSPFSVIAKNIDLTGLGCPLKLGFTMGDSVILSQEVNEAIVNGRNTLIPTRLMRLSKDTLVVRKAKTRSSTRSLGDSLSVSGDIAVADMNLDTNEPNLVNEDVNVVWGSSTFTIPFANFKTVGRKHLYKCSRSHSAEDPNNLVTATIDLDKCTYSISVKDVNLADVDASGIVTFGINFATPNGDFNKTVDVNLVTRRSY